MSCQGLYRGAESVPNPIGVTISVVSRPGDNHRIVSSVPLPWCTSKHVQQRISHKIIIVKKRKIKQKKNKKMKTKRLVSLCKYHLNQPLETNSQQTAEVTMTMTIINIIVYIAGESMVQGLSVWLTEINDSHPFN